jgi:integrase
VRSHSEDQNLTFPNRSGKPINADKLYHRGFKPLHERAELSGFTFHSLRHTCATLLLSKNINPKIVSEILGHATISQTMDTYSQVMPRMGDVAATALEGPTVLCVFAANGGARGARSAGLEPATF